MSRTRIAVVAALGLAGCAEVSDAPRISFAQLEAVQVSKLEPAPTCRPLGAMEGSSGECSESVYEAAYDGLRRSAAVRGGNYVVIDSIRQLYGTCGVQSAMAIQGRLFSCPSAPPPVVASYGAECCGDARLCR